MWKRRIILDVIRTDKDSEGNIKETILKTFVDHRIDFVYYSLMGGKAADTCEIKIFNLGKELIQFFADGTRKKTNSLKVKLRAGYVDEFPDDENLPTVIEGEVMNVFGQRILPEHVTTLYCVPTEGRTYNSAINRLSISGNFPLREVIKKFAVEVMDMKEDAVSFRVNPNEEAILDAKPKPLVIDGTTLEIMKKLTSQHHLLFNLGTESVTITTVSNEEDMRKLIEAQKAEDKATNTVTIVGTAKRVHILDSNLLRATPDIQLCRFEARVAMNTVMQPLDVVDVSRINGFDVTGGEFPLMGIGNNSSDGTIYRDKDVAKYTVFSSYQIESLVHTGSNYTQTWETSFKAFVLRDNNLDNGDLNQKVINQRVSC